VDRVLGVLAQVGAGLGCEPIRHDAASIVQFGVRGSSMSDAKRTQFAVRAITLAETFNVAMADERVRGPISYRVELSAPDGMSTAGGKQATQHVKLIPESGGTTIVAGSANS